MGFVVAAVLLLIPLAAAVKNHEFRVDTDNDIFIGTPLLYVAFDRCR